MISFFKRKKAKEKELPPEKDSVDAMLNEAQRQGWLPDRDLGFIPEIMGIYKNAAEHFFQLIGEAEPRMRETLVYHTCRYLFAKGVEGVLLWGASSDGKISVFFHPKHLNGNFESEVAPHLHKIVVESMAIGESLFKSHQSWVIKSQKNQLPVDIGNEIEKTLEWIPRLAISYALFKKYQVLR